MNVPTAQWLADNGSNPTHVCVCGGVEGGLSQGRTNAKSTNNADTNSTGDPAQEAVPCAWDFTDVLHVMIW